MENKEQEINKSKLWLYKINIGDNDEDISYPE